ncbi:SET domain-containing protein-lysine N-methyltransferase [Mesorhizobium sp. LSJC264A00]|uniref:SET domain-containing protein-lysine N-methyltransferase n=1 Tax=unclassified Mesorhizobium TaxID=325217 RepID=UPI000A064317
MSNKRRRKPYSILNDDAGCARVINARNVNIRDAGKDKGRGVFSSRHFLPGEVVMIGLIDKFEDERTIYTIQIDWNIHATFEEPAVLSNHSCNPNLAIVPNRFGAYDFIAIHEISREIELTWDYATTEFDSIAVQVCLCSSKNCRGAAGGFSTLPPDHPLLSAGYYAPYLQRNAGRFPRGIGMFASLVGS